MAGAVNGSMDGTLGGLLFGNQKKAAAGALFNRPELGAVVPGQNMTRIDWSSGSPKGIQEASPAAKMLGIPDEQLAPLMPLLKAYSGEIGSALTGSLLSNLAPPQIKDVAPGATLAAVKGGKVTPLYTAPGADKEFTPTNMQIPGTDRMALARTPEQFNQLADAGYVAAGSSVPGQRNATENQETWSGPVAEVGPDGKPIQVRYGSRGPDHRQVVPGATPARQGNAFDRPDYWRKEFKPYLDSAQNTVVASRKVRQSLGLGSGIGDIAAINAVQKQIDEGAVVREQDVALIQSAQSIIGRFLTAEGKVRAGTVLTPDMRTQLQQVSDSLTDAISQGVQERIQPYVPTMKSEGVEIENIVPAEIQKVYGWKKPGERAAPKRPTGAPESARIAADGHWYSPDPKRPGKYLKW